MKLLGGNKNKGLLFIVAALVCGLLAVIIVLSLGSKLAPSVPALEAVKDVKMGTPLDRSMFKEVKLAEASVPSQLVDVNVDFTGLVAAKDIAAGDILREPSLLSLEGNPALFSARLRTLADPNLRAVQIPTNSMEGLISGMGNGDKVDIIAVYNEMEEAESANIIAPEDTLVAKTIVRAAPVIGVRAGDEENIEGSPATLLIVALTEEQVETVSLYRELGNIYASLRPFGDDEETTAEQKTETTQSTAPTSNQGLKKLEQPTEVTEETQANTPDKPSTEEPQDVVSEQEGD